MEMRNTKRTQAIYDQLLNSYDQLYGEEQREKHDILLNEIKIKESMVCLDLGCGTGALMSRVANKSRLVMGVDLSLKMVLAAKNHLRRNAKCAFICADGEYLPFRQHSLQTLFAVTAVLDHLSVPGTIDEANRTLSPGGVAVFTIVRRAQDFHLTEIFIERAFHGWEVRKMQLGRDVGWLARKVNRSDESSASIGVPDR